MIEIDFGPEEKSEKLGAGHIAQTDVGPRIGENVAAGGGTPDETTKDQDWTTRFGRGINFI